MLIKKDLTLQSALEIARLIESTDRQTKGIENSSTANKNGETVNAVQKVKRNTGNKQTSLIQIRPAILKLLNRVKLATGVALFDMCHVIAELLRIRLVINVEIWDT